MTAVLLAMDRATVRRRDPNGFLHVEMSNISKANVCPYYGREIPDWEALGLDPENLYRLYRDPAELARAASTFDNVPLLSQHVPVVPEKLPEELIIGSTGTDAEFAAPYLRNSLVVWCGTHQRAIEENRKRELSCGYRYRADMTPGQCDGLPYDGVMRDIIGNHVALVIEGRAGPDVLVGDETMKLKSRTALMISGAVAAFVRPKLAKDAKVDLTPVLSKVDAKSFAMDGAPKQLAGEIEALVKPHLAADESVDLTPALSAITPIAEDEDAINEPEPHGQGAGDAEGKKKSPDGAMDEVAVAAMIASAVAKTRAEVSEAHEARTAVRPVVGEVAGADSAIAIYKFALDSMKVDLTDVPEQGYKGLFAAMSKVQAKPQPIAQDAQPSKLATLIPNLQPMGIL